MWNILSRDNVQSDDFNSNETSRIMDLTSDPSRIHNFSRQVRIQNFHSRMKYYFENLSLHNDPCKYMKNTMKKFHRIIALNVSRGVFSANEIPSWEILSHDFELFLDESPRRIVDENEIRRFKIKISQLMTELTDRNVSFHHEF